MLPAGREVEAEQISARPKEAEDQMLLLRAEAMGTSRRAALLQ